MYKAIGFDYSGVIEGEPGNIFMEQWASILNVPFNDLKSAYFANNHRFNVQKMHWNDIWPDIIRQVGRGDKVIKTEKFLQNWSKRELKVNQDIVNLMHQLKDLGFKVGILSNYSKELRDRLVKQDIMQFVDVVGTSSEMGCMKPHPDAFFKFSKMLDVNIKELIFIDDTPRSLETASEIGYTPILFTGYDALAERLKVLGVL